MKIHNYEKETWRFLGNSEGKITHVYTGMHIYVYTHSVMTKINTKKAFELFFLFFHFIFFSFFFFAITY